MTEKALTREELLDGRNFPVTWELYSTTACNLKCSYCYNIISDHPINKVPQPVFSIQELLDFLKRYAKSGDTISFIGGEPFVKWDYLKEVIEATEDMGFDYYVYTNGTLNDKLPKDLLNKFSYLSISIDGDEEQNDKYRGEGSFQKVIDNVETIKPYFTGKTIGRMTVVPENDLTKSIPALIGKFDVIYWQYVNGISMKDFPLEQKWKELEFLLEMFIKALKKGEIIPLYPFIKVLGKLLDVPKLDNPDMAYPLPNSLGCGAGYNYVQIFTTGDLYACPEILLEKDGFMGNIKDGITRKIGLSDFKNTHKCTKCPNFDICHCRCIHFTPPEYCVLIDRTIKYLRERLPEIKEALKEHGINEDSFAIKKALPADKETKMKNFINYVDIEGMF